MDSDNYRVLLSVSAEKELDNIYRYIALNKENPIAAQHFIEVLRKRLLSLRHSPKSYGQYHLIPKYNVIHIRNYKVLYRVDEKSKTVVISHIFHSLQRF